MLHLLTTGDFHSSIRSTVPTSVIRTVSPHGPSTMAPSPLPPLGITPQYQIPQTACIHSHIITMMFTHTRYVPNALSLSLNQDAGVGSLNILGSVALQGYALTLQGGNLNIQGSFSGNPGSVLFLGDGYLTGNSVDLGNVEIHDGITCTITALNCHGMFHVYGGTISGSCPITYRKEG